MRGTKFHTQLHITIVVCINSVITYFDLSKLYSFLHLQILNGIGSLIDREIFCGAYENLSKNVDWETIQLMKGATD